MGRGRLVGKKMRAVNDRTLTVTLQNHTEVLQALVNGVPRLHNGVIKAGRIGLVALVVAMVALVVAVVR